jgi:hypothetical protein
MRFIKRLGWAGVELVARVLEWTFLQVLLLADAALWFGVAVLPAMLCYAFRGLPPLQMTGLDIATWGPAVLWMLAVGGAWRGRTAAIGEGPK